MNIRADRLLFTVLFVVLWSSQGVAKPEFQLVELGTNLTAGRLMVSGDGRVIVGTLYTVPGEAPLQGTPYSFFVDRKGNLVRFDSEFENQQIEDISDDGSVIIYLTEEGLRAPRVRTKKVDRAIFGPEEEFRFFANALSGNGEFVVGTGLFSGRRMMFRLNLLSDVVERLEPIYEIPRPPLEPFPFPVVASEILATSFDGSQFFAGTDAVGAFEAVRFNADTAELLGHLGHRGDNIYFGAAVDASSDGSVIVGVSTSDTFSSELFRWEDGVLEGLGINVDFFVHVSGDGRRIVGQQRPERGRRIPFYWAREVGVVPIEDYLTTQLAIDLGDYTILEVNGLSHDGRVLIGIAQNTDLERAVWTLRLDRPIEDRMTKPGRRCGRLEGDEAKKCRSIRRERKQRHAWRRFWRSKFR